MVQVKLEDFPEVNATEFLTLAHTTFRRDQIRPVLVIGVGPEGKGAQLFVEGNNGFKLIDLLQQTAAEIAIVTDAEGNINPQFKG